MLGVYGEWLGIVKWVRGWLVGTWDGQLMLGVDSEWLGIVRGLVDGQWGHGMVS